MDDDAIQRYTDYEREFLALVVQLFSAPDGGEPIFSMDDVGDEQRNACSRIIADIFMRRISQRDETSVRYFSHIMMRCAVYYHMLTPPGESTLQRALGDLVQYADSPPSEKTDYEQET